MLAVAVVSETADGGDTWSEPSSYLLDTDQLSSDYLIDRSLTAYMRDNYASVASHVTHEVQVEIDEDALAEEFDEMGEFEAREQNFLQKSGEHPYFSPGSVISSYQKSDELDLACAHGVRRLFVIKIWKGSDN